MNLKISIIIAALVAGVALMLFSTSGEEGSPQYQLSDFYRNLEENPEKIKGRTMTIFGFVKEGSLKKSGIEADFIIEQDDLTMSVHFTGKTLLPDTFEEGADVSLDGRYDIQNGIFVADKAMAKCGSKYIPKGEEGASVKHPDSIPRGE